MPTVRAVPSGTAPPLGDFPALEGVTLHITVDRETAREAIKDMAALPFRPALNRLSSLLIAALQASEDDAQGVA